MDSITLTSSSAEGNRHNGNKGTGATVRRNSASRHLVQFDGNATVDTMTFSWIEFDGDDDTVSNGNDKQMFKCTGATELYIQNNLIHSFGAGQDSSNNYTFLLEGNKNVFSNNFVFNIHGGEGHSWYVFHGNSSTAREQLIYNNTFYDIDKQSVSTNQEMFAYMDTHANSRIRNNIIFFYVFFKTHFFFFFLFLSYSLLFSINIKASSMVNSVGSFSSGIVALRDLYLSLIHI